MTQKDRQRYGRSFLLGLVVSCAAGQVYANGAPPAAAAAPSGSKSARPADAISLIEGDADAWSVSNTDAGCYLMSPRRKGASRLAIGRHPVLGQGLFAVGLSLAMAGPNAQEPIGIETAPLALTKPGQMTAAGLLFVALGATEMASSVDELRESSVLWIRVRTTSIAHRGKGLEIAITGYIAACVDPRGPSAPEAHHE